MTSVDPREFTKVVSNNEIARKRFLELTQSELDEFSNILELKNRIKANEAKYAEARIRLPKITAQHEKVKEEYWARGAGWAVEHLKIEKNRLKYEMNELQELLVEPNKELQNLEIEFQKKLGNQKNFEVFQYYKTNFETFVKQVHLYSVFKLTTNNIEESYLLVPEWVTKVATFGTCTLLSEDSSFGRCCLAREIFESFYYHEDEGTKRLYEVVETRLISTKEILDLIYKINVGFVIDPNKNSKNSLDLNNLGHLASPVPFGGGGERRFNQLRPY